MNEKNVYKSHICTFYFETIYGLPFDMLVNGVDKNWTQYDNIFINLYLSLFHYSTINYVQWIGNVKIITYSRGDEGVINIFQ